MSDYDSVLHNVEKLIKKYKSVIKSEKHLTLLYWKDIDGINVTKESISTRDFLEKATPPQIIGDSYWLIKFREQNK